MEPPLDRSTIWPYDDGEPGPFFYARVRAPDRASKPSGRSASSTAATRSSSPRALGATTASCSRCSRPATTVALAAGRLLRHRRAARRSSALGARATSSSTRPGRRRRADLVWIEAPSNPFLTMPDFEAAAAHPARVVCDATAATPVHLRPLEHGCDVVLHSRDEVPRRPPRRAARRARRARRRATRRGCASSARAPASSPRRTPRGSCSAGWRRSRSASARQTRSRRREPRASGSRRTRRSTTCAIPGFGGLLSFDVADGGAARRVETATHLIVNATSLGGVHSTIESRHRWEGDRVPPGLLRLSVGLEDRRGALGRPRAGARRA